MRCKRNGRSGFTLIELLITITIIGIMAGMILFALFRAQESAKAHKTRAVIAKLDAIIKDKWQTYQYRRVPIMLPPNTHPKDSARIRLECLRDIMRMELPDRWSDIEDDPIAPLAATEKIARPSVSQGWWDRWFKMGTGGSPEFQNAECLYMLVMKVAAEDGPNDVFRPDNIGDVDKDGANEFIDGWGMPIRFIRWPAGFVSDLQPPIDHEHPEKTADPFDPMRVYPNDQLPEETRAIYPLIYSAGPNKCYGIASDFGTPIRYASATTKLNPFTTDSGGVQVGTPKDFPTEPNYVPNGWLDNIHNHLVGLR